MLLAEQLNERCCLLGAFSLCIFSRLHFSAAQNGVYKIITETASGYTNVYCQMTLLTGCSGGGWTMVIKINGAKVRGLSELAFNLTELEIKRCDFHNRNLKCMCIEKFSCRKTLLFERTLEIIYTKSLQLFHILLRS